MEPLLDGVGGIVLCGGDSTRMGQPKAWLPVGDAGRDERMLQRVVRILGEIVTPIVVVAAPGQEVPPLGGDVKLAHDPVEARGPLQGVATGLAVLAAVVHKAYVATCDAPLTEPAFVRRLVDLSDGYDVAVPEGDGFLHPLSAVYRTGLATRADELLEAGRRRVVDLIDACDARHVPVDDLREVDPDLRSLVNVNNEEDYQAVLAELRSDR